MRDLDEIEAATWLKLCVFFFNFGNVYNRKWNHKWILKSEIKDFGKLVVLVGSMPRK